MLKILIALSTLGFLACSNTGPRSSLEAGEGQWEYIEEHATTKDSAFVKTIEWIAVNYNSANDVIQLQDKEAGKIVVKGAAPFVNVIYNEHVSYTLAMTIKDQKMKFEFTLGKTIPSQSGGYAGYPPSSEIPKVEAEFKGIKDALVANIRAAKKDDF